MRDSRFKDAHTRCLHSKYDQENGRFQTHELQFVRYNGAHQWKDALDCREFEQLSNKTSLPTGCGVMDGDLIIKTTVSTNSLYGLKLFRIAQCIYCAVNDEFIPPETFNSLSFKIRVLHGYPAERLLNILSSWPNGIVYFWLSGQLLCKAQRREHSLSYVTGVATQQSD